MIVLGIDPGYAIVGWGVVHYDGYKFKPIAYGAITTPAKTEFSSRLQTIYNDMNKIIERYKPDAMSIEQLFFTNNQKTAIDVAQARGVILLSAKLKNLPIYEYTPLQVKQSVVGYGRAVKNQVIDMTCSILKLKVVPKLDDTADALALAICHGHCWASNAVGKIAYY